MSEVTGIFASDQLIRHALLQGIKEIRASPWLLDAVLAGMRSDDLTSGVYAAGEIAAFKKFVLKTEFPVFVASRLGPVETTCITINLQTSSEAENTTSDTHYTSQEDVDVDSESDAGGDWPDLTAKFTPAFDASTGTLTLPVEITQDIFPGMVIMDAQGQPHEILTSTAERVCTIAVGPRVDFRGATLRGGSPSQLQTLESAVFNETYLIGCHVQGEAQLLTILHSLVVFILLWGRESLLEGRGFECSSFSSTDFAKNQSYEAESVWSRYVSLSGKVRHAWPKRRSQKVAGVKMGLYPSDSGNLPSDMAPADEQSWMGSQDILDRDSIG